MDVTTGIQDVNITVTPPPALSIAVPSVTNVTMPITGVGGLKGDKGDTGPAGTTDYTLLTNKPTLGTAAATAVSDYATSAQGAKADTAVQPATLTSNLATKANSIHTHSQADVSSLVSDLAAKAAITYVDSQDTALQGQITTNTNNISSNTTAISGKQATLVSGTNIKTVNGTSLLGSGDIAIAGGSSAPDASTTVKGIVQLAGDLAGTAAVPTVPGLAGKEPTITAGTTSQYYRGDKTFQTLDKTAVGLGNVDNTSDATKNSATATLANKTLTAPIVATSLSALDAPLTTGSTADVLGTSLAVMRNAVQVGRIDNNANGMRVQAQTGTLQLRGTGNNGMSVASTGNVTLDAGATLADATDIALGSTTGNKIGTATTQKLGFYGATPVVQQSASTDLGTTLANLGLRASGTTYTLSTSGTVSFSGSFKVSYTNRTANATLSTSSSYGTFADATTAAFTITLPTAVGNGNVAFKVIKTDSSVNAVTISSTLSQLINGATTYALSAQYKYVEIISNGTQWYIINAN